MGTSPVSSWGILQAFLCTGLCTNDSRVPGRSGISENDPLLYEEFRSGTWVVNKNAMVPFCSIGADHALEQINRSMKVAGGLVGITLNAAARINFFLIAPELARLIEEAKLLVCLHQDRCIIMVCQVRYLPDRRRTIQGFTNPFTENAKDLCNIVTKSVLSEHM